MKLSDLSKSKSSPEILRFAAEETRDEYRGMKVYQFEMNKYELDVARAAVRKLHEYHQLFYMLETSTESSLGKIMEDIIDTGIDNVVMVKKMMEEMADEHML